MNRLRNWLTKHVPTEQALEGEIATVYTETDRRDAPSGHMPLPGTDVEVVAYPINEQDLMLLANKGGVCVFRSILAGALRNDLDVMQANLLMTEQRIVLGEPSESMQEMIREMLEKR
jgi:hypothetical protein